MRVLCGIDIVDIERIKSDVLNEGFRERVFTADEIKYCENKKIKSFESYAARFAAKEAFAKALGTGFTRGISLKDIEIERTEGKPRFRLHNKALEILKEQGSYTMDLSISHNETSALASVVILIDDIKEGSR